jgi:hypothetical protein
MRFPNEHLRYQSACQFQGFRSPMIAEGQYDAMRDIEKYVNQSPKSPATYPL